LADNYIELVLARYHGAGFAPAEWIKGTLTIPDQVYRQKTYCLNKNLI